jgi:phosphatidyl-myo-inositol dimannoside synthase
MKVLLVSALSYEGVAGSGTVLRGVIEYLARRGDQVEVLTYGTKNQTVQIHLDSEHSFVAHHIGALRLPGASSLTMLARLVSLGAFGRFDLILCGVASPTAILTYLTHSITRSPYSVYSHGEDVTEVTKRRGIKRLLLAPALHAASAIMANSHFTRDAIAAFGIARDRILYMPPWVDRQRFDDVSPEQVEHLRARWDLEGKRVILTVARLAERKGHDTIIRALPALCADIPNLHYVIVGHGDQQALRKLARDEGVADHITFVEYVPDSELPALYHLCDLFAMVSRWDRVSDQVEGFGIVYLEAAACAKPTVAGSAGGCADAVQDGVTGLIVDPTSVAQTRDALRQLLMNPEWAASMGKAGREWVRERFDREIRLRSLSQALEATVRRPDYDSPEGSRGLQQVGKS